MDNELKSWIYKYGIEKISESALAYSYLILTSKASARHGILGDTAPALAAHWIFYDNLEDVIDKAVSLKDDIGRYQRSLKYARSTLDYSIGKSLYMLPSDMLLKPLNQVIEGYNDMIVVNISGLEPGRHVEKHELANHSMDKTEQHKVVKLRERPHTLNDHNDEVTSIILAIGSLTLFAFWWVK